MAHVEKSIDIEAPLRVVYNQWTQFEDFPRFMEGVKEVRQLDAKTLRWRAEVGGKDVEWTAEISEQVPDSRIAWRSTGGAPNSGIVEFAALPQEKTRVTLRMEYEPVGALESTASALGVVGGRISGDLKRFKEFIEARGRESGGWRGEIRAGEVKSGAQATQPSQPASTAARAMGASAAAGSSAHEGHVIPGQSPLTGGAPPPGSDLGGSSPLAGKPFGNFP